MIRLFLIKVIFLFFTISSFAQIPENRPSIENQEFDAKLINLLSFSVPLIGVEELKEKKNEVYLLDAREKNEYDISHIPNARYIGFNNFSKLTIEDIPKDAEIVIYCSVGYRSEKLGERLQKWGYSNIKNLYGSIFEWVNSGNEVENRMGEKTKELHTYNKNWSQWVIEDRAKKIW